MSALNDGVPRRVDELDLRLRRLSPQDEDDGIGLVADLPDDLVGEGFPARPLCERGSPARSVRIVLSIRTPCFAHGRRQPLLGIGKSGRSRSSLNMFLREAGSFFTVGFTEKQSPCAIPSPGYGSCPSSSTLTLS